MSADVESGLAAPTRNSGAKTPVMLYNEPHQVHARMATAIGASLVPAETQSVKNRLLSAATASYSCPLILEGGVPLLEGVMSKRLGRARGPVILLAADETQANLVEPLPYYTRAERAVHRWAHHHLDGVIAVSPMVAAATRKVTDAPVRICRPFILGERFDELGELEPDLDGARILSVGESRPGIGHDILVESLDHLDGKLADAVRLDLVGKGTEEYDGQRVTGHGYVDDAELLGLFESADLFVHAGRAGAYPVTTLEACRAGLPTVTTASTGTREVVVDVHPRLLAYPWAQSVADSIQWYFDQPVSKRYGLSMVARRRVAKFTEKRGRRRFQNVYDELLEMIR